MDKDCPSPVYAPSHDPGEAPAALPVNGYDPGAPEATPSRLCGYLDKLGGRVKSWKCRWFVYEDSQCQLLYYRTAQDVSPLGRVGLASATFGFPDQGDEDIFQIQTPERTFILKAVNRDTMMYWLQQLQVKRWQHCLYTGEAKTEDAGGQGTDEFLPTVKTPTGLVGEEAAGLPAPRQNTSLSNISFKHPLTEIQNSVRFLRSSRNLLDPTRSVFYWEERLPSSDISSQHSRVTVPDSAQDSLAGGRRSPLPTSSPRSQKKNCGTSWCTNSEERASQYQLEVQRLTAELCRQKELVVLLQKALEECQREKHPEKPEQNDQLRELERCLAQRDAQVAELEERLQLMTEKNLAKKEVVLKLAEQVADCMAEPQYNSFNTKSASSLKQLHDKLEHFRDDIEAYKMHNKFLNSEIYQLTRLWRNSSEQEKILMKKCADLEVKIFQKESRYLALLHKLQGSEILGTEQQKAVTQLTEEAQKEDRQEILQLIPVREYDDYGFKIIPDYDPEEMKILAKVQKLEIRSHNPLQQEVEDKQRLSRWAQYLGGRPSGEPAPSQELKQLVRGGIPRQYRGNVWRWVVWRRTRSIREHRPQLYQELCRKAQTSQHPASRQIQLDLHRTLTSNQHFSSPSGSTLLQLQRILLAFSWQNPTIGYCQGLNRLAAIALLVLKNEEDAFWCLVAVVDTIMPQDYYSKNLTASQADQRVFKDFMAEKLPRLLLHLEEHSVDVSLVTFNWFLVVFVESLPSKVLLRVWDAFLYEGTKVIFRYALAVFKYKEEDILKLHDSVEIYQYLRFFTKTISDGRKLMSIAFYDMNPFRLKVLENRRTQHLERLHSELRELERMQEEFVTERAERKDKDLDTVISEDEEET